MVTKSNSAKQPFRRNRWKQ